MDQAHPPRTLYEDWTLTDRGIVNEYLASLSFVSRSLSFSLFRASTDSYLVVLYESRGLRESSTLFVSFWSTVCLAVSRGPTLDCRKVFRWLSHLRGLLLHGQKRDRSSFGREPRAMATGIRKRRRGRETVPRFCARSNEFNFDQIRYVLDEDATRLWIKALGGGGIDWCRRKGQKVKVISTFFVFYWLLNSINYWFYQLVKCC